MRKTLPILALAAALVATGAAADPKMVATVQTGDLDLESISGREALERRIIRAARALCATDPALESGAMSKARADCQAATLARMSATLDDAVRAQRARTAATASTQR